MPHTYWSTAIPTIRGSRIPPLDGLRGLAILMVMFRHYGALLDARSLPLHIMRTVSMFGWTGVDLFFVLSGFLITGILLDSREAPNYFSAFYARRVLRIFPVYYFSLLVMYFLVMPHFAEARTGESTLKTFGYIFYLQNWFMPVGFMAHYWSLAVEEQFYLMWPMVVFLFPRHRILPIALGVSVGSTVLRLTLLAMNAPLRDITENTFTRLDALLIGAACACLVRDTAWMDRLKPHAKWMWLAPALVLPFLDILSPHNRAKEPVVAGIGLTLIDLSFAALLLSLVLTQGQRSVLQGFFINRLMRAIGKYSYAAYIWHILVMNMVEAFEEKVLHVAPPLWVNILIWIAATFLVCMVSYALIERPFLNLKRYFEPRLAGVPAAETQSVTA